MERLKYALAAFIEDLAEFTRGATKSLEEWAEAKATEVANRKDYIHGYQDGLDIEREHWQTIDIETNEQHARDLKTEFLKGADWADEERRFEALEGAKEDPTEEAQDDA